MFTTIIINRGRLMNGAFFLDIPGVTSYTFNSWSLSTRSSLQQYYAPFEKGSNFIGFRTEAVIIRNFKSRTIYVYVVKLYEWTRQTASKGTTPPPYPPSSRPLYLYFSLFNEITYNYWIKNQQTIIAGTKLSQAKESTCACSFKFLHRLEKNFHYEKSNSRKQQ